MNCAAQCPADRASGCILSASFRSEGENLGTQSVKTVPFPHLSPAPDFASAAWTRSLGSALWQRVAHLRCLMASLKSWVLPVLPPWLSDLGWSRGLSLSQFLLL